MCHPQWNKPDRKEGVNSHGLYFKMAPLQVPLVRICYCCIFNVQSLLYCTSKAVSFTPHLNCRIMTQNACSRCIINTDAWFFLPNCYYVHVSTGKAGAVMGRKRNHVTISAFGNRWWSFLLMLMLCNMIPAELQKHELKAPLTLNIKPELWSKMCNFSLVQNVQIYVQIQFIREVVIILFYVYLNVSCH